MAHNEHLSTSLKPDYEYGNRSAIDVVNILPGILANQSQSITTISHLPENKPLFSESQLQDKVTELADNYTIFGDPKSTESSPKHFGVTVLNRALLDEGVPAILAMSTNGSSLYDEKANANNEGNALELAYMALAYPDKPIVFVESPGNGNSVDLQPDEYKQASLDGKLIHEKRNSSGKLVDFEAFETLQSLARALSHEGVAVSHISSNASGAHFSSALMTALPKNSLKSAFLYNPSNISDRSTIALTLATFKEILTQGRYEKVSKDPLKLSAERKAMARLAMGSVKKSKIDQARASTHNPIKLKRQQEIFRRGNKYGQSAAFQAVAGSLHHPELNQTFIFPEFAAQYKQSKDFVIFMKLIQKIGGKAINMDNIESLKIPMGQYGHSHYPSVRQTLESYAFQK
ncbi:MAG: hypothetical protein NVS1B10_06520 [Candidatus Saccharimonadales bacterium]